LAVSLSQRGAAFDVGEKEGDGARGGIGHACSPRCRVRIAAVIVARSRYRAVAYTDGYYIEL